MSEEKSQTESKISEFISDAKPAHASVTEISNFNRDLLGADEGASPSLWLITFTDIMALMLTFFVLLYSMSVPEEEKWDEIVSSLNEGFSKFYSQQQQTGPQDTISIDKINNNKALDLSYLRQILDKTFEGNDRLENIILINQSDRLIMSLPQDLLFESGATEISLNGKRALFSLGGLMTRIRNRIEIVGHADPRAVSGENAEFSSNWSLSLARAAEVSAILKKVGYRRDMVVRGVSSARFDELPNEISGEERLNLARRVDIVIMEDDGRARNAFQIGN